MLQAISVSFRTKMKAQNITMSSYIIKGNQSFHSN